MVKPYLRHLPDRQHDNMSPIQEVPVILEARHTRRREDGTVGKLKESQSTKDNEYFTRFEHKLSKLSYGEGYFCLKVK